jgi:hypothetical protein
MANWRTGTKVPQNLYEGDEPRGMLLDPLVAARVAAAMNGRAFTVEDVPWLVKDFDVLYRAAKAAVDSIEGTTIGIGAALALSEQLARLEPAARHVLALKVSLVRSRQ